MKNKICSTFAEAIFDINDGASIIMYCWGVGGTAQNLIRALCEKNVRALTVTSLNFVPINLGKQVFALTEEYGPLSLANQVRKVITAWPGATNYGVKSPLVERMKRGEVELELSTHGTLTERIRAGGSGIGGFYTRVGVGTILEKGKEKKIIDGEEYILERPLKADFGFVRADKADKLGNLTYRGSTMGQNPLIAMASKVCIAEVDNIVEIGKLSPEVIGTPHIFVDRIVKVGPHDLGSARRRETLRHRVFQEGYTTPPKLFTDLW